MVAAGVSESIAWPARRRDGRANIIKRKETRALERIAKHDKRFERDLQLIFSELPVRPQRSPPKRLYAREIQKTTDGRRGRLGGETGGTEKKQFKRSFKTNGEIHDRIRA